MQLGSLLLRPFVYGDGDPFESGSAYFEILVTRHLKRLHDEMKGKCCAGP